MNNNQQQPTSNVNCKVGDRVTHKSFGAGEIIHVFGRGNKVSLAIKFPGVGMSLMVNPTSTFGQLGKIE